MAHQALLENLYQDGPAVYKAISVLLVLATVLYLHSRSAVKDVSRFPLIGQNVGGFSKRRRYFVNHALELFLEGYLKFKDSVWRVTSTDGEVLVLPLRYAEELRELPEDVVSSNAANEMTFETKLLGITPDNPLMVHVVKSDLTHNLSQINASLALEVSRTVSDEVGLCEDWTEINISQKLLKIVAIVSGHVFLGPDLCRREEYLHASIDFTVDLFTAIAALKRWPKSLRFAAKYWIPQLKTVNEHRRRVHEFLVPILRERRALRAKGEEPPKDMLQWLLDKSDQFNVRTDEELAETQLILGMAAIHTTTMTATQIIYDLIGYCPEVIPELRAEVRSVQATNGGVMTTQALYQMKLLDSVMRESQRQNPSNIVRMQRCVLKPVRFSDGTEIPAGTSVAVPALPTLQDPKLYSDPSSYDPYRFARLRAGQSQDLINYAARSCTSSSR
ncbi:hypothetical protein HO173_007802 [Letharia columbiana]|uniref:Cytochrome P450 n=1 Tax=Letharia columbiana TaxID=112416 RepID=A0A8H6FSN0_9LECA|nr:uncharacterized protein HO173_007802 [Letharia columbiana]KAF6233972.1 hypothetical protein HO173_007802 [Letharia columbiana]